jgi:hypothetical protein
MPQRQVNVGGTSGGFGEFILGLCLIVVGLYMIFTNTSVYTSFWYYQSYNLLGPLIVVFLIGIVFLFVNGASLIGWLFTVGAVVAIVVGIIMNLRFQFHQMTLLSTLMMFGLPAVGLGITLRALKSHESNSQRE